jgi:Ser/Thr protein kinase RdoA (MazF antagonist)
MRIDPHILSEAAKTFGIGLSSLRPLGGVEGMALEYTHEDRSYVLKVTPKNKDHSNHSNHMIAKFNFITFLADNGVRVARPILSPDGNWVEIVESNDKVYLISAATKAAGKHIELYNPNHSTPGFFEAWGQVTGQMHRLTKSYPSWQKYPQDGGIPSPIFDWKDEVDSFRNWCQYDDIRGKWTQISEEISVIPKDRDGYGLIHNDLHPHNFLVNNRGEITVIDFDVCAYHYLIKDIAIALFFVNWLGNPGKGRSKDDYLTSFLQNFMKGYSTENSLSDFWYLHLPLFVKHHQILLFIVFTDEWKTPNSWQSKTLRRWKQQILNDIPVVNILF